MNPNFINNQDLIDQNDLYENNRAIYNLSNDEQESNQNEEDEQEYDNSNEFNQNLDLENEEINSNNNDNNNSIDSQGNKPIYVMSLELEDGNIAKIKIYSNSNPIELAKELKQ